MISPGRNVVISALKSDKTINTVFLQKNINEDEKISLIKSLCKNNQVVIEYVDRNYLDKIVTNTHHQGVVADVEIKPKTNLRNSLSDNPGLYIGFKDAQYEHNIGAIIRTAEVAGAKGIILPPKQEITPTIIRMSTGSIFYINIYHYSLFQSIKDAKNNSYQTVGLDMDGNKNIFNMKFERNCILLVGGEDKNLSDSIKSKLDDIVSIPQYGKINSLNMSVATGITIYKWTEQNHLL